MNRLFFEKLQPGCYDILHVALEAAQLPTDDLLEPGRAFFGFSDERRPLGYIGLEGHGPDQLVRSLVVLPSRRCQGYGTSLLNHLETWASDAVERFHLLTTTAAAFFAARGYGVAFRSTAPCAIATPAEFTRLCPASATYMTKSLIA